MSLLDKAIMLAATAHYGQKDKGGQPYILHPLRVMFQMQTDEERIVAALHDVIEDSAITFEDIMEAGFSDEQIAALDSVTRRPGEPYDNFIQRARKNGIGRRVKIGDLKDNMDTRRIPEPTLLDWTRLEKYKRAYMRLMGDTV